MPGPFTVDASVFLNAFNEGEAGHAHSREFLDAIQAHSIPLILPTLILPEVAAAISRGTRKPELGLEFANSLSRLANTVFIPVDLSLARHAAQIAAQQGLRGSDSVYIAVANRFATALVTNDRQQRERCVGIVIAISPLDALNNLKSR